MADNHNAKGTPKARALPVVLPPGYLHKTDEELGQWLVGAWLAYHARQSGINPHEPPLGWVKRVMVAGINGGLDAIKDARIESALRKAINGDIAGAGRRVREHYTQALVLNAIGPSVARDISRQAGTQKERGSRMPKLDAHIAACLDTNPKATASDIWQSVPCERDDFKRTGVYRDGGQVVEYHDERERPTGRSGFAKRVTAAKRSRKPRL